MAGNFAWGIDIGNRALKAVKLVREGDGLRVDDFEVVEHETVLSNAGDNREALVTAALSSFVQRHPFKWKFWGSWGWVLKNPRRLSFRKCKGFVGLFKRS